MKLDLSDLKAFVAIAELASFRKAAHNVHLSQSAVSRRITKIEGALGVQLLERTTRSVRLTAVGREFNAKARAILSEFESLVAMGDITRPQTGEVTVACVPSAAHYLLPDVLTSYRERFPAIRVRLIDEGGNMVLAAVVNGEADFGIDFFGAQDPDIDFQAIVEEPFVVVCRRGHPLTRKTSVPWSELESYGYMSASKLNGNRLILDLALARIRERPRWLYEVRHASTLLAFAEAGLGVAVVPRLSMQEDTHPTLTSVPLIEPTVTRCLGLIRRRGRSLSPAAQELYSLVEAHGPTRKAKMKPRGRTNRR